MSIAKFDLEDGSGMNAQKIKTLRPLTKSFDHFKAYHFINDSHILLEYVDRKIIVIVLP
jgi:hypothetical protein